VKEVLKIGDSELESVGTRPAIRLRNEVLAVVHLQEALSLGLNGSHEEAKDPRMPVVIVDCEEKKIGLGVDKVIGTGEIVIKSLSRHYREIEGLIGASILGNGRIALIVDVEALVRQYYHGEGNERTFTDSNIFNFQASIRRSDGIPVALERPTGENETDESSEVLEVSEVPEGEEVLVGEELPSGGDNVPEVAVEAVEDPQAESTGYEAQTGESQEVSEVLAGEEVPESGEEAEGAQESPSPEELAQEISEGKGALLEEIHNAGAIQASMAVSKLTGQEIRVSFPESQIITLSDVANNLGGEEVPVGGIYVGLAGELSGGMLIVLPEEHLLKFHEFLYRQQSGTCTSLEEVDFSGISELGNILSASFICAMSDETKLGIKNEAPEIIVDMCLSVIDSVLARFNQPGERILLTKALLFISESEEVVCHLLMFLEPESLQRLIDVLGSELG
jgi:chemotaxis protein CheC